MQFWKICKKLSGEPGFFQGLDLVFGILVSQSHQTLHDLPQSPAGFRLCRSPIAPAVS